ncbi:Histone deacetylase-like amidohydrolase [Serratia quinivorans]|nr:Histone deacetylase-like amidohydrolase [Serratia quinivorans]
MGFCFLANIPIAIERAKAKYGLGKVSVLDWDVHHGNGTQHIYWQRDDVLTLSLHQDGSFPAGYSGEQDPGAGAGEGYNINIPLLAFIQQQQPRDAFNQFQRQAIDRLAQQFKL